MNSDSSFSLTPFLGGARSARLGGALLVVAVMSAPASLSEDLIANWLPLPSDVSSSALGSIDWAEKAAAAQRFAGSASEDVFAAYNQFVVGIPRAISIEQVFASAGP